MTDITYVPAHRNLHFCGTEILHTKRRISTLALHGFTAYTRTPWRAFRGLVVLSAFGDIRSMSAFGDFDEQRPESVLNGLREFECGGW
jgi:hypothetical protein